MQRSWTILGKDSKQYGPYSTADIATMLASGEVAPDYHVWSEEYGDWMPIELIPELMTAHALPPLPQYAPEVAAPTSAYRPAAHARPATAQPLTGQYRRGSAAHKQAQRAAAGFVLQSEQLPRDRTIWIVLIIAACAVLTFGAVVGGYYLFDSSDTPEDCVDRFQSAFISRDGAALWLCLSEECRARIEKDFGERKAGDEELPEEAKQDLDAELEKEFSLSYEEYKKISAKDFLSRRLVKAPMETLDVVREISAGDAERSGDKASLKVTLEDGSEGSLLMVKIGGRWYVEDLGGTVKME